MSTGQKVYIAIDLKSFYASVECVDRGLDPLTTNLVVADASRTEKTICLAVSPPLKACGISGRPRLFEVVQQVREINARRRLKAPGQHLVGESWVATELERHPELALAYIVAPPRMARYIQCSSKVYEVYLRYIAPQDIHVYSIDEVFMDVSGYLRTYGLTPRELAEQMVQQVLAATGITATVGIGTNLYLSKIAMDIMAKHAEPDAQGVRLAELDEYSYRRCLWSHRPLTDFWRIGHGYARKLEQHGLYTMGDIARCSVGARQSYYNEELLYKLFGINAELLIDHAWGWEPCTMAEVHSYRPGSKSLCQGQVLPRPYSYTETRLVVREMADLLSLDLVAKGLVTNQLVLTVGYDKDNLGTKGRQASYRGAVSYDGYGRAIPRHAHGTANLERHSASSQLIIEAVLGLLERIADKQLLVRRLSLTANNILRQDKVIYRPQAEELDLFAEHTSAERQLEESQLAREARLQQAVVGIWRKCGKNAVLKGMNLEEGATTKSRNQQIGGHRA